MHLRREHFVILLDTRNVVAQGPTLCLNGFGLLDIAISTQLTDFAREFIYSSASLVALSSNLSQPPVELKNLLDLRIT